MTEKKGVFARLKQKHWDEELYLGTPEEPWIGIDRPPLRRMWIKHKGLLITAAYWLGGLIGGALILKLIGLA